MSTGAKTERRKLYDLVERDAHVERLGAGFASTEGPLWNKEGGRKGYLDFVSQYIR